MELKNYYNFFLRSYLISFFYISKRKDIVFLKYFYLRVCSFLNKNILYIYFIFLKLTLNCSFLKNYSLKLKKIKCIFNFLQFLILVQFPIYNNFFNLIFNFYFFNFSIGFILNNFFLSYLSSFFFNDVFNLFLFNLNLIFFF